ncbi:hypothetical protein P7C73_g1542, partial [Tremellales sp. Uapishka_1]
MPVSVPIFYAKSLTDLIAIRAAEQGDQVAVWTGAPEFGTEFKSLTYSQVQRAVDRLAKHYAPLSRLEPGPSPLEQVISVLTSTAIDMSLLEIALAKLGLASFLLSVNNSVAAVAHLCKQTKSTHLIYGPKFKETAEEVQEDLKKEGFELELVPDMRFPLWGEGGIDDSVIEKVPPRFTPEEEAKRTCVILHSSGSTGFPKPNYVTHYGMIANLHSSLAVGSFSALPQQLTAVPYVLKLLAETEEGLDILSTFVAVSFAGAAVPDDLGDRLVSRGVPLFSIYGTTETGTIINSRRDYKDDKAWNWLRVEGLIESFLTMEPRGGDTFELVVMDGWPPKLVSNRPDGSYATKDLFLQHPKHANWFKYIGRLDDTLTQTLGEKTNPVPIELAIRGNSPYVNECIVFGDARPQVGCLLKPSEQAKDVWQDKAKYLELVWPVIAEANANAPTHSRILPEMVEILPIDTEIPVATKMSILRPACYKKYKSIIDDIYDRFENGTGQPKQDLTTESDLEAFLIETIESTLKDSKTKITRETDLFAYGVDSLQATRIRNVISKSLELNGATLGQNIVYEHPSVENLAKYLSSVKAGGDGVKTDEQQHKVMLDFVDKYSSRLETGDFVDATVKRAPGEVVVVTGATGSLGAHILDQLTKEATVRKVICLSRAKSHEESRARIEESLKTRQRVLSPEALSKIVSYASDVNAPNLGLSEAEYDGIRKEITAVIHNAWPVNFVLSIESYDVHIGGALNLVNLTLQSPHSQTPKFYFSSSVATRQGKREQLISESFSDSPSTAAPMGYGRSKWTVEKLVEKASEITKAQVGVFRIGQLCGDDENGVWNETEAWPLMIKSANVVGTLPILTEQMSWLPVNLAGKAIKEIVLAESQPKKALYHILNPNVSGTWNDILEGIKDGGVKFQAVDRREWVEEIKKSNPDPIANPSIKLSGFYANRFGKDEEKIMQPFDVAQTSKLSPTIADAPPITKDLVSLWVRNWKNTGFIA